MHAGMLIPLTKITAFIFLKGKFRYDISKMRLHICTFHYKRNKAINNLNVNIKVKDQLLEVPIKSPKTPNRKLLMIDSSTCI